MFLKIRKFKTEVSRFFGFNVGKHLQPAMLNDPLQSLLEENTYKNKIPGRIQINWHPKMCS